MGELLQVRVSVSTYDPAKVQKRWPRLFVLGFGQESAGTALDGRDKGVMELARALAERAELDMLPEGAAEALGEGPREADALRQGIEDALADWKPSEANRLTDELESRLDALEKDARNL